MSSKPTEPVAKTPASRARVLAMKEQAVAMLSSKTASDNAAGAKLKADIQRRTDEWAKSIDTRPERQRLGYSVGDAEGDKDVA